jgi:opacity protein-like surface antigen/outer membrane protein OmpA-like peptidoglycan-associated protein
MNIRLKAKPITSALISMALCASMAVSQDTSTSTNQTNSANQANTASQAASSPSQQGGLGCFKILPPDPKEKIKLPDTVELDPFGGISIFGPVNRGLDTKHLDGVTFGGRVGVNVTDYVGLEVMYQQSTNNVRFLTPVAPGLPTYDFSNRIGYLAFNPVFHFTPRGSRIRPYVTVGVGAAQFTPTDGAKNYARLPTTDAVYRSANLNDNLQVALNYGGGIKIHLTDHFGLRFDGRGFLSRNPTYNLPDAPTGGIYVPRNDRLNGVQLTAGAIFYLGKKVVPQPRQEPLPPLGAVTITGGEAPANGVLCQGKPISFHVDETDPAGHVLAYSWKLNGATQGSNSPDFSFTPNNGGDFNVEVEITDTQCVTRKVAAPAKTVHVTEYTEPVISSFTVSPKELDASANSTNTVAQLQSSSTGSPCGGNLTYKWTVSEGTVTGDSTPNATFDAKSLNFDQSSSQPQTKTVTATLTVTDETGKSVTKSDTITITWKPPFVRVDDVVFSKNSARINNCGKRILIDEIAPKLSDPNYTVVLVGHIDEDEVKKTRPGRRARVTPTALDEQRVLNAAAVLTGGTGTCGKVDPSQVQIDFVGTEQGSDTRPGLCGTSATRAEQKERKGSVVSDADKNRRVEIYLVPKGSAAPPAVKNPKPLPVDQVKKLGCPK